MMLLTFCLSSLLLLVNADYSVHILSRKYYGNGQLVTSSILNWIPDTRYSASKNFVIGGYENVKSSDDPSKNTRRPIFVCRAQHNGIWVAGGQKEGDKRCTVTLTGSVKAYTHYQLLENVESAARINWTDWSKYDTVPVGAVATEKLYVARHVANEVKEDGSQPSQTHYIGTLNSQDTLGTITYVKEDGTERSADSGQLLVETEPISYELSGVKLNYGKRRVDKSVDLVLGVATIKNTGSTRAKLAEAFGYEYLYSLYWGQGHAMLKGLNTTIILQNKTRLPDVKWGIDVKKNTSNVYTVEVELEPGTAVNVTLRGKYTDTEVPYTGKLFSRYEDGAQVTPRTIDGVRREESITDIVPEFGPIYYLSNFSFVPTTVPPPTTEPTTTTTMPTTMPTTQQQQTERFDSATEQQYHKDNDVNAILGKRPEATGMQGDDGGPLSLKDKNGENAAPGLAVTLQLVLGTTMLAILNRVT